jgi:hypothetical protein
MQTNTSFSERTEFLGALLRRQAETSMGPDERSPGFPEAYCLGYLTAVIAGKSELYEALLEELASLGLGEPR